MTYCWVSDTMQAQCSLPLRIVITHSRHMIMTGLAWPEVGSEIERCICRTLEDLSTVEKGLAAAKEKLIAMSAQAAHTANQLDQQPT